MVKASLFRATIGNILIVPIVIVYCITIVILASLLEIFDN